MVDVRVRLQDRVYLLDPLTDKGRQWLISNTTRAWKWLSGSLAVDGRYAGPIVDSMIDDGLEVEV
jgi:hypothetical protein